MNYPTNNYSTFAQDNKNQNDYENQESNYELEIRLGFIRKVYGIISIQLLLTVSLCIVSLISHDFKTFLIKYPVIFVVAIVMAICISLVILCFSSVARKVPTNYLLLFAFTICEAYIVSYLCARSNPKIVMMAASLTCFMVLSLTFYAFFTKTDFTLYGSLLFVGSLVLLALAILLIFFHNKVLHVILCCLGVFLFSLYLIYDTQLLIGNKENSIGTDEYIVAALMIYVDIVNIFTHMLGLFRSF